MHTAICAFDDRRQAELAVEELLRADFSRRDVHIEHKDAGTVPNDAWDGLEREVAMDRKVLDSFGRFFASLLGKDHPSGHVDTYARHVERGAYVVVVDAADDADARRAEALLRDLQAGHLDVVHRPGRRPLRELVGEWQAKKGDGYEAAGSFASPAMERDRAMASSNVVRPTTGPELRQPEVDRAPGLRYADKDKPD